MIGGYAIVKVKSKEGSTRNLCGGSCKSTRDVLGSSYELDAEARQMYEPLRTPFPGTDYDVNHASLGGEHHKRSGCSLHAAGWSHAPDGPGAGG